MGRCTYLKIYTYYKTPHVASNLHLLLTSSHLHIFFLAPYFQTASVHIRSLSLEIEFITPKKTSKMISLYTLVYRL